MRLGQRDAALLGEDLQSRRVGRPHRVVDTCGQAHGSPTKLVARLEGAAAAFGRGFRVRGQGEGSLRSAGAPGSSYSRQQS